MFLSFIIDISLYYYLAISGFIHSFVVASNTFIPFSPGVQTLIHIYSGFA